MFHANLRLAAQNSIDKHTILGLIEALKKEKTKRSRGKRLNLCREEDKGPQFYSPSRVLRAKAYAAEKEALEQAEAERIATKKAIAAANKAQKEQEKIERSLQTLERRRRAAEKKVQHAVDVQARKELRSAQKAAKSASKPQSHGRIPPTKVSKPVQKPKEQVIVLPNEVVSNRVKITTSRGRTTIRTIQGSK